MVDLGFALGGGALPRAYRIALADALERFLPWLAEVPGAGMHRLNAIAGGDGDELLLSRRTRLRLRVPRERAGAAAGLQGQDLRIGAGGLHLGAAHERELLPHGTLYAHLVAADQADETEFLRAVQSELAALDVICRPICGRRQEVEGGAVQGFSLMLDGLSRESSLRILESGLGPHRRLGCGLFIAHRSAAAVGAPH